MPTTLPPPQPGGWAGATGPAAAAGSSRRAPRAPGANLGQAAVMDDSVTVRCPYCREHVELYVDPDSAGQLVEDCAVCCRPWLVTVERDRGRLRVQVVRAQ
ncbi:MAG: CPXCG motif-containing cysteine-rich protein [Kofleriaceae bacterium]